VRFPSEAKLGLTASGLYLGGFLTGLLCACVTVYGAATTIRTHGVRVHVETAPLAAQVEQEVRAAVRREVPVTLNQLKAGLPQRVAQATADHLAQARIEVAGFSVPVPPAAAAQVQSGVQQVLTASLSLAVTDADMNALADRLSEEAGDLVEKRLAEYLANRTFDVEVFKGYKVPVTLVPR
jgi:hypothetical protein